LTPPDWFRSAKAPEAFWLAQLWVMCSSAQGA